MSSTSIISRKVCLYREIHALNTMFFILGYCAGVWSSPVATGKRPPPCSGFSFTLIDNRRAVMFAGYHPELGQTNDTYTIDLQSMVCKR